MQLIPVTDKYTAAQFLQTAVSLYQNDMNWIRPLDKDINDVFDCNRNKTYRFGKTHRWILKDEKGNLIGRIAAFINKKYKSKGDDVPVGGIGFFECINDQTAANYLFDTAKQWLQQNDMEAMDGPINFGERDRWWGLVTEGFHEPLYCMNYNPPYYVTLFENYGFKIFFNQVCFGMHPKAPLNPKIFDRHAIYANNPDFYAKCMDVKQLEKFAGDFTIVYNKAWAGHGGLKQLHKEQVLHMFQTMKPVMDERIIWFIYNKEEPIAIFVNLPELNQWFKYLGGRFGMLQKLYFLWLKKTKPNKKFSGLVFGVVPEWQGKGIDAFMVVEAAKIIQGPEVPYTEYEMQWIGDFNPKMINIAQNLSDTFRSRNLATYRYLFDRTKEFKRHPILN
ncbi:MAG: hypothetical protein JST86_04900 [Bacteroidetes bacterium]|nr:hypothetical protein [Bacteroidota bacterium]